MAKTLITPRQLQPWTEAEAQMLFASTLYNLALLKTTAGKEELDRLQGVTSSVQEQLDSKLDKQKLKIATNVDWTDDTTTATALAIAQKVESAVANAQIGGAMAFKGNWSTKPAPTTAAPIKAGYTYTYDSGTPPTGATLEPGDMLVAAVDITSATEAANAANWVIVQTNIAGAVTTIESELVNGRLLIGKGGKTIGQDTTTGILKVTSGVPSAATKSDVADVVGSILTISDKADTPQFNLNLGDVLKIASTGPGGDISFNPTTKEVVIEFPQHISIQNGTAVNGQYISGLSIGSDGVITITRANLPPDVTQVSKTTTAITGTKNGTNRVFTLPENAVAGSVMLFLNGQCLVQGSDYTLSGTGNRTITFATDANIPVATDVLSVYYIKL